MSLSHPEFGGEEEGFRWEALKLKIQLCLILAVCPVVSNVLSLSLSFLCERNSDALYRCHKDEEKSCMWSVGTTPSTL